MSKGCKICWIVMLVFFVANITVLSLWLMNDDDVRPRSSENERKEEYRQRLRKHFMKSVGVDSVQFAEMEALRKAHVASVVPYQEQIDSLKGMIMNQTFSAENDSTLVKSYIVRIALLQNEIEYLNYAHYKNVRSRCANLDQQIRLDSTFRKLIDDSHHKFRRRRGRR